MGSRRCDCGRQLDQSLALIADQGGVVVYLRGHEGRGVGLLAKLSAYALQDEGADTVDAQILLGLPVDAREYGAAAAILAAEGVLRVELLTNNPAKADGLRTAGIDITGLRPLVVAPNPDNLHYLSTKRDRMGHPPARHAGRLSGGMMAGSDPRSLPSTAPDGASPSWLVVARRQWLPWSKTQSSRWRTRVAAATVVRVPGTFELPVACRRLADHFDGAWWRWESSSGEAPPTSPTSCAGATQGIIDVMTRTGTPIGFGVLTCDTEQQALARAGLPDSPENKGREAAEAVPGHRYRVRCDPNVGASWGRGRARSREHNRASPVPRVPLCSD